MTLRLGVYAMPTDWTGLDYVIEAERLGVHSAWIPEYWGFDALTPLAVAAAAVTEKIKLGTAIVQLGARTPAMLGMSALSLQQISEGRFILGAGTSGPQGMGGLARRRLFAPGAAHTRDDTNSPSDLCWRTTRI